MSNNNGSEHEEASSQVNRIGGKAFLDAIWRSENRHHQIASFDRGRSSRWRHVPVTDLDSAIAKALVWSHEGQDCYLACAEFETPSSRKAENAVGACTFWFDLDCGIAKGASGAGYETTSEAREALTAFCNDTGIPEPTHIVESGGGLHVYFGLDAQLNAIEWKRHATQLKELAKVWGLRADPTRTADIASLMRFPGTLNHKYTPPRPVELVQALPALSLESTLQAIRLAHGRFVPAATQGTSSTQHSGHVEVSANDSGPVDLGTLKRLLDVIDPDCGYEEWLKVLMGVFTETGGSTDGLELVTEWSRKGTKFKGEEEIASKWRSFRRDVKRPVRIGTLFKMAQEAEAFTPVAEQAASGSGTSGSTTASEPAMTESELARRAMLAVIEKARRGDAVVALEATAVEALACIKKESASDYEVHKAKLKEVNSKVSLPAVDRLVRDNERAASGPPTHHNYAMSMLRHCTVNGCRPVTHESNFYVLNPETKIWVPMAVAGLVREVANNLDGAINCVKAADYRAIAQHTIDLATDERFFAQASVGIACLDQFYRIKDCEVCVEPLSPEHRQRVRLEYIPARMTTPLFDQFLSETFKSERVGEEQEQVRLLQEIAGAIMTGTMHRYQKAVLFYDPFGRAGKGTMERILRRLVPADFVTAVSPLKWDQEYYVIQLLQARLNVAGELPETQRIPGDSFKSVLGGDPITGRHPTHRPVTFKNEAAHLFMSNNLITATEHGDAFFARWLIVEFPNSRLRSGLPLDPGLPETIVQQEMPGIAQWALEGARRVLSQNGFSQSKAHDRLLSASRRGNSSVEEFIHEECDLGEPFHVRRAQFYERYKNWCSDAGRRAQSKSRFKTTLENSFQLGISAASLDGYEIFRGVQMKPLEEPTFP